MPTEDELETILDEHMSKKRQEEKELLKLFGKTPINKKPKGGDRE